MREQPVLEILSQTQPSVSFHPLPRDSFYHSECDPEPAWQQQAVISAGGRDMTSFIQHCHGNSQMLPPIKAKEGGVGWLQSPSIYLWINCSVGSPGNQHRPTARSWIFTVLLVIPFCSAWAGVEFKVDVNQHLQSPQALMTGIFLMGSCSDCHGWQWGKGEGYFRTEKEVGKLKYRQVYSSRAQ